MNYSTYGPIRYMLALEAVLFIVFLWLAVRRKYFFGGIFRKLNSPALVCLSMLALRLLTLPLFPKTPVNFADDIGFLFQGATFASGRLANPVPANPDSLTPFYVVTAPHWVSQYQPGQGLAIAIGFLLGNPVYGVWLSSAVLICLLAWALRGMFSPRWTCFGLLFAAAQWLIYGPLVNSLHGGVVAAIGGVLIVGALLRRKATYGLVLGAGLVLVASTRPLEGLLWTAIAAGTLLFRKNTGILLYAGPVTALGFLGLCFYNHETTRGWFVPPYFVHMKEFGTPQGSFFLPVLAPGRALLLPDLSAEYLHQVTLHERGRRLWGWLADAVMRTRESWEYYIGPLWSIMLLFLPFAFLRYRWLAGCALIFFAEHSCFHAWFPHHSSPELGLYVLLLVAAMREMCCRLRYRHFGWAIAQSALFAGLTCLLIPALGRAIEPVLPQPISKLKAIWYCEFPFDPVRSKVESKILASKTKALVFVRYGSTSNLYPWIANLPNLDQQPIVWARDLNSAANQAIRQRFADRSVWFLEVATERLSKTR